jgi:hypothetical protein
VKEVEFREAEMDWALLRKGGEVVEVGDGG